MAANSVSSAETIKNFGSESRRAVRDAIADGHIMERIAKDIHSLLLDVENAENTVEIETDILSLWDDKAGIVPNAVSYGKELDDFYEKFDETLSEGYGTIESEKSDTEKSELLE
jgi:hypothetical protein